MNKPVDGSWKLMQASECSIIGVPGCLESRGSALFHGRGDISAYLYLRDELLRRQESEDHTTQLQPGRTLGGSAA